MQPLKTLPAAIPWLLLSGILLVVTAAGAYAVERLAHLNELRTTGIVTEVRQTLAPDGSIRYATHIRFQTAAGIFTDFTPPPTSNQEFKPGDTVPLLYSSMPPIRPELGGTLRVYPIAVAIGSLGIALFDLGIAYWLFLRRGGVDRIRRDTRNLRESVRRT